MDTLKQMNLAMQYIESRLTDEIDYGRLAQIACCSQYHFRRVFSYLAGMPLYEYIRLRRLAVAAQALRQTGDKIIDIALRCGYDSPDAFAKAFVSVHGVTPSQARKGAGVKAFLPMSFQLSIRGGTVMNYRIVEKQGFKIAGKCRRVKLVYEGANEQIDQMWASFKPEDFAALKQLSNTEPRGLISASCNFSDDRRQGSELDQYIGAATTLDVPARWDVLEVEPCAWAVFSVEGEFPSAVQSTWARIYSEWLPGSHYEVVPGPEMLWNEGPDTSKPDFKSEIWIPVRNKSR